jgi:16S rRNA G966 N2-methylase RsmD
MTTQEFIRQYREEDVRQLALRGAQFPEIDMPFALNQIAGWQTACRKIPSWTAVEGVVYPPHLSMEQCSSEQTARYKTSVAERLLKEAGTGESHDWKMVDLTGGFGVDFSFLSPLFDEAVYVEQQEHLCRIAQENFLLLGLQHTQVVQGDGVEYLRQMEPVDLIFLDPARRDVHGARTYALHDCTPDLLSIRDELLGKARWVMVKLSPMLDWHKAVSELRAVREVHIVSVENECKELLLVLQGNIAHESDEITQTVVCCNDTQCFSYRLEESERCCLSIADTVTAGYYLYEPHASTMKAGCFAVLTERYGVKAVGKNSHLFISRDFIGDFPGRKFQITAVSTMNKRELKTMLNGVERANIAVRNFPLTVQELRKRLKVADGGDLYLFGTTTAAGKHIIIAANKA